MLSLIIQVLVIATTAVSITAPIDITTLSLQSNSNVSDLNFPSALAFDSTNGYLYISDTLSSQIKRISISTNTISVLAGSGENGLVDGYNTSSSFSYPYGISLTPSGSLVVADTYNNKLRVIDTVTTMVTTIPTTDDEFNSPFGVAVASAGLIYVSDTNNFLIKLVAMNGTTTVVAGNGVAGTTLESTLLLQASFMSPTGIAIKSDGNLVVSDSTASIVYLIDFNTERVSPLITSLRLPFGVALDSMDDIYVSDVGHNQVVLYNSTTRNISVLAGSGEKGLQDGLANEAQFKFPNGLAFESGSSSLFVTDVQNGVVRRVSNIPVFRRDVIVFSSTTYSTTASTIPSSGSASPSASTTSTASTTRSSDVATTVATITDIATILTSSMIMSAGSDVSVTATTYSILSSTPTPTSTPTLSVSTTTADQSNGTISNNGTATKSGSRSKSFSFQFVLLFCSAIATAALCQ